MEKTPIYPNGSNNTPYSPALKWGELLFVSGQVASPEDFTSKSFIEETREVFEKLEALIIQGGSSKEKILKLTVYLTDIKLIGEMNSIFEEVFEVPRPPRSTIQAQLVSPFRIEIDAIAHI